MAWRSEGEREQPALLLRAVSLGLTVANDEEGHVVTRSGAGGALSMKARRREMLKLGFLSGLPNWWNCMGNVLGISVKSSIGTRTDPSKVFLCNVCVSSKSES